MELSKPNDQEMVTVRTRYKPAIRYLKSAGHKELPRARELVEAGPLVHSGALIASSEVIFSVPRAGIYVLQKRLHRRARGSCLKFGAVRVPAYPLVDCAEISQCSAYPGPYEGECLEVESGGPGHGGGRDAHMEEGS